MRSSSVVAVAYLTLGLLLFRDLARGQDPRPTGPKADIESLEKRAAELRRQLTAVKKELKEVRGELRSRAKTALVPLKHANSALSPDEAIKQDAKKMVTVEFGVGSATFLLDKERSYGTGPVPPIVLGWDGALKDGAGFFVMLSGTAVSQHVKEANSDGAADEVPPYPSVKNLEQFCKQIQGRGIRVTGRIQAIGPPWSMNHQVVIDDPDNFEIIK